MTGTMNTGEEERCGLADGAEDGKLVLGDSVGKRVVGRRVGDVEGANDGEALGLRVTGDRIGRFVGDWLGRFVGDKLGRLVGDLEGDLVGEWVVVGRGVVGLYVAIGFN